MSTPELTIPAPSAHPSWWRGMAVDHEDTPTLAKVCDDIAHALEGQANVKPEQKLKFDRDALIGVVLTATSGGPNSHCDMPIARAAVDAMLAALPDVEAGLMRAEGRATDWARYAVGLRRDLVAYRATVERVTDYRDTLAYNCDIDGAHGVCETHGVDSYDGVCALVLDLDRVLADPAPDAAEDDPSQAGSAGTECDPCECSGCAAEDAGTGDGGDHEDHYLEGPL